jgi:hypothetical protein
MDVSKIDDNWRDLRLFLPKGWTSQAKKLGALGRKRGFKSANALLRTLLIHLASGCSLKETAARAKQGGISNVSAVALSKRLKNSQEWFNWMSSGLLQRRGLYRKRPEWLSGYEVKTVDASVISEPGSTGTDWRLHYSMSLFNLKADQFHLTNPRTGESFANFTIKSGEVWLADRVYCVYKQLKAVKDCGADFLVRYRNNGVKLLEPDDRAFNLLGELKKLKPREVGHWYVKGKSTHHPEALPLRVCAIAKSKDQADKAVREYRRESKKKGKKTTQKTLELQRYIIILTSMPDTISAEKILELYRMRWQVEIAFKRMKSLLGLGQLPKKDPRSCLAWLEGKMFVALLIQSLLDEGNFFSPWGYPLRRM